jgi:hypothetical protein
MRTKMSLPTPFSRSDSKRVRWLWVALLGVALLLIWPLQLVAISMIGLSALMVFSILEIRAERDGRNDAGRRASRLLAPLAGLFALAVVLAFVWPSTVAQVGFALLLMTCLTWCVVEYSPATRRWFSEQGRLRRERAHTQPTLSAPESLWARRARAESLLARRANPFGDSAPGASVPVRSRVPKAS